MAMFPLTDCALDLLAKIAFLPEVASGCSKEKSKQYSNSREKSLASCLSPEYQGTIRALSFRYSLMELICIFGPDLQASFLLSLYRVIAFSSIRLVSSTITAAFSTTALFLLSTTLTVLMILSWTHCTPFTSICSFSAQNSHCKFDWRHWAITVL